MNFKIAGTALLFSFASLAYAQAPAPPTTLTTNPVFEKQCAKCHGKNATGRHFAGPSLVNDKVAGTPPDTLRNIIENGQKRMPKFAGKLAKPDIDKLVDEIQALNHK